MNYYDGSPRAGVPSPASNAWYVGLDTALWVLCAVVQLDCLNSLRFDCGLEDCLDLLRALALPSLGDKLSELDLECVGLTSEEREELVNEAARLIREGAWPRLVGMEPGGMWDMSIWLGGEGHAVDLEVLVYGWAENGFDQAIYDALQARRGEIETACI